MEVCPGRLATEPDNKSVPEARGIALQAAHMVQFRIPEIDPGPDPTFDWTDARYAPMLWAMADGAFAVAVRSILSVANYEQLTAPWRAGLQGLRRRSPH